MRLYMSGGLGALESLMEEKPGFNHYDDGCDGRYPECRNCRYHLPYSRRQDCVFEHCPHVTDHEPVSLKGGEKHGCIPC